MPSHLYFPFLFACKDPLPALCLARGGDSQQTRVQFSGSERTSVGGVRMVHADGTGTPPLLMCTGS